MKRQSIFWSAACIGCVVLGSASQAAVSPDEAAALKTTLTPFGAEKAGNKDGSIPAWTGGYTTPFPGWKQGELRPDPFKGEKPLYSINAANMAQYDDELPEGAKALMKRYPDYRIDVYPTHRTAAAPQWVYDGTYQNALKAETTGGGLGVVGARRGIPFPIPKTGFEVMWNHELNWRGLDVDYAASIYVTDRNSSRVHASSNDNLVRYTYYMEDQQRATRYAPELAAYNMAITTYPPFLEGTISMGYVQVNPYVTQPIAWSYLPGQRRVRKAPEISYDTPSPNLMGQTYYDTAYMYNGPMDRYQMKLIGKKEMIVPYNENGVWWHSIDETQGPHFGSPDYTRWEKHRVWIVDATLAPGKNHAIPHRRFAVDEDTWWVLITDEWDGNGQLLREHHGFLNILPEVPTVTLAGAWIYNLQEDIFIGWQVLNAPGAKFVTVDNRPDSFFTPQGMTGRGVQ